MVIAKAVTYFATLGAAGGVAFLVYCEDVIPPVVSVLIRQFQGALLGTAALASAAKVLAMSASLAGDASGLFDSALTAMVLRTGEGHACVARAVGLGLLAVAVACHRPPVIAALLGSVLAATSFAWVGHVHALGRPWLWTAVLVVHLAGVGFWVGALMPLWVLTRRAGGSVTAAAARRFGGGAVAAVGMLVVAGIALLYVLLHDAAQFFDSDYGRLALCKIICVALLLALAAMNRLRLTPRLRAGDAAAVRIFGRSVMAEIVLALLILSVTAAMTTLTGPAVD